jgi:TP901 family phage tail tape measure protein
MDKKVTLIIAGSAAGAVRSMEEVALAADAAAGKMGKSFDGATSKVGGAFSKLGNSMASFGLPFSGAVKKMGASLDEAESKGKKFGATMAAIGKAGLAIGVLGVVAVGVESIKTATKFQAAMEMLHTQAQVPQDQIKKLEGGVLSLAGKVGTGPDSLATALYHIESTLPATMSQTQKYSTAMEELKLSAEGAKVGHSDLEMTTNALNAVVSSGIPGVQNLSQAMGSLNAIVGAGDMKMQDLSEAMGSGMVAVVKGYGLSLNDVGAALATFGDNNIRGADAATMTRTAVQALAVPAKGGAAALKALGLSSTQLATDMQQGGLNKAMVDLHDHLVKAGDTGVKTGLVLTAAFGKKAGTGLQVLQEQFDRFEQKEIAVKAGAGGFAGAWQATTQTLSFQMSQAKETVAALADKIGLVLIPWVQKAAVEVSKWITWLEKHKLIVEIVAGVIGGVLVTAIGYWAVGMAAAAVATIAATWPILAIIAACAAVGVGIYLLATHWKQVWSDIKQWAGDAWHWLEDNVVHPIVTFFVTRWHSAIDSAKAGWDTFWGTIKQWAGDAWHWLEDNVVHPIVTFFVVTIPQALDGAKKLWDDFWNGLKSVVATIWGYLEPIFKKISDAISTITGGIKGVVGVASKIAGGITGAVGGLFKAGGGPVAAGQSYVVGEKGPEWFTPGTSGVIHPNGTTPQGGGVTIHSAPVFHIYGSPAEMQAKIDMSLQQYTTQLSRALGMA